jgi:hypothetical protein
MRLFGSFTKIEEQDDGTVKVYGVASSEARDSDGETISADAMRAALPDYLKFGAVREMHQPTSASGTAIEAEVRKDGSTFFGAHVVDPIAVKKVRAKVYKGFSIGGKITKRNEDDPSRIEGIRLTEISLVDRPANPDATFSLVKFDDNSNEAAPMARPRVKSPKPEAVAKGMYDVSMLAELLDRLKCLQSCAEWEAEAEDDASPIPAKLRAAVTTLGEILVEMVAEETSELNAGDDPMKSTKIQKGEGESAPEIVPGTTSDVVVATDEAAPVADAPAPVIEKEDPPAEVAAEPVVEADAEADKVEKAVRAALVKLGITVPEMKIVAAKADDGVEDLAKVTTERDDLLTKLAESETKLTKAQSDVAALVAESDALVESLKKKGVLKVVGKGEDVAPADTSADDAEKTDSISVMKKVHRGGGKVIFRSPAGA